MGRSTPEGKVKEKVKRLLKAEGIWYYMPMQNGMGVVGIPDFICCWDGRFFAIETKAPGKRNNLTANQLRRLHEIDAAGGLTLVADCADTVREYIDACKAEITVEESTFETRLQERIRSRSEEAFWLPSRT